MASGIVYLELLPVVLGFFALVAFVTSYAIAVHENDVNALWPYISDAGARPPQSCIFGQFLNISAVIAFVAMYIHYKHVTEFNITALPLIQKLNYWSLWIGALSCLGLSVVANFQVVNSLPVHMIGALMIFGLGMVYCWIQAVISQKMRRQAMSSALSCYTRFALSFLVTVFFIITLVAGNVSVAEYNKNAINGTKHTYDRRWKESDKMPFLNFGDTRDSEDYTKYEGVRGFYKGLAPNVLRVTPACALTFVVYENVIHFLMPSS